MAKGSDGQPRKKLEAIARALIAAGEANTTRNEPASAGFAKTLGIPLDAFMSATQAAVVEVEVLTENQAAYAVFLNMQTQWRVGMSGRTGLDYGVLPVVFELTGIAMADRQDTFEALQILEYETIKALSERD